MKDWVGGTASTFKTIGASNHCDHEREVNDYYATEPKATDLLLQLETFDEDIWEPACGEGHISKSLIHYGYKVKSTDLIDRGYGMGGIDFLKSSDQWHGSIITNPPYRFATEFVKHALDIIPDGSKVAMFLKLTFLEGKTRKELFKITPPPYECG